MLQTICTLMMGRLQCFDSAAKALFLPQLLSSIAETYTRVNNLAVPFATCTPRTTMVQYCRRMK